MVIVASDLLHLPIAYNSDDEQLCQNFNGVKFEQTVRQESRLRPRSQIDLKCVRA